jgi:hypothetical protein
MNEQKMVLDSSQDVDNLILGSYHCNYSIVTSDL